MNSTSNEGRGIVEEYRNSAMSVKENLDAVCYKYWLAVTNFLVNVSYCNYNEHDKVLKLFSTYEALS